MTVPVDSLSARFVNNPTQNKNSGAMNSAISLL